MLLIIIKYGFQKFGVLKKNVLKFSELRGSSEKK